MRFDAVILAGGRSRRMGTDKAALLLADQTLLQRAVAACADAGDVVVVAPAEIFAAGAGTSTRARQVVEDPPFSGPLAGIAAGVGALRPTGVPVLVLPCDLPQVAEVARLLTANEIPDGPAGRCLVDSSAWAQPLAAVYQRGPLLAALAALGDLAGVPARALLRQLRMEEVEAGELPADVDDPASAVAVGIVVPPTGLARVRRFDKGREDG